MRIVLVLVAAIVVETSPQCASIAAFNALEITCRLWLHRMQDGEIARRWGVRVLLTSFYLGWAAYVQASFSFVDEAGEAWLVCMMTSYSLACWPMLLLTHGMSTNAVRSTLACAVLALCIARPYSGSRIETVVHVIVLTAGEALSSWIAEKERVATAEKERLTAEKERLTAEKERLTAQNEAKIERLEAEKERLAYDLAVMSKSPSFNRRDAPRSSESSGSAKSWTSEQEVRAVYDIYGGAEKLSQYAPLLSAYFREGGHGTKAILEVKDALVCEDRELARTRLKRLANSARQAGALRLAESAARARTRVDLSVTADGPDVDQVVLSLWRALQHTASIFKDKLGILGARS